MLIAVLGGAGDGGDGCEVVPALHDFSKSAVYFTLSGSDVAAGGMRADGLWARPVGTLVMRLASGDGSTGSRAIDGRGAQCLLFCAVSWSVAFTLSLSWPAFEAMVLPGLGLLVAPLVEGVRRKSLPLVYAGLGLLVMMQMREKLDVPFGFDYQDEASGARCTFGIGAGAA